jgi:ankyrin repeat protein
MGSSGVHLTKTLARQAAYNGDLALVAVLTAVAPVREREASVVGPFNLAGLALHSGGREVFNRVLAYPELQPLAGLRTVSGCTPLMLAVWANDAGLFTELLRLAAVRATVLSGPGVRFPINMRWPSSLPPESFQYRDVLELAIQRDKRKMVAALLQVQEVLDAVDTRGDYAQKVLLQCIQHRMPELALALLQRPLVAKVARIADSTGMTALHHAAQQGQTQTVETLLRMLPASEIARPNRAGKSAALLAEEAGHGEIARILVAADVVTKAPVTQ